MTKKLFITVLSLLVAGGSAQPSTASPDEPPGAHLRLRGERIQRAHLAADCWPDENGGLGCSEQRPMTWPQRDRVGLGTALRLRVQWKQKPEDVYISTYASIRRNGKPRERRNHLDSVLRPRRRDGRIVAWEIVFRPNRERLHYISVLAHVPHTVVWNVKVRVVDPG